MTQGNWEHNEGRPATMRDVNELLKQLDGESTENEPISALNQRNLILAKNSGYPKPMYHATLDPVFAMSRKKEAALQEMGYQTFYIPRTHPKMLFRRNMSPKFEQRFDVGVKEGAYGTTSPVTNAYVEERMVRTVEEEKRLLDAKEPPSRYFVGQWVERLEDVDPLPEALSEDPSVTIARLQGQVDGLQGTEPAPKRRGRKAKAETVAA